MTLAPFVHEAVLEVSGNSDDAAPGAAVTLELCGSNRIEKALRAGSVSRPDGTAAHWDFLEGAAATLSPSEAALAGRLAGA